MQPSTKHAIYSYALIHALHKEGHDYVEVFYPFLFRALPKDHSYSRLNKIKEMLRIRFGFDIPRHALETIIKKAIDDTYVEYEKGRRYALTQRGLDFIRSIEDIEKKQQRRINRFLHNMTTYINNIGESKYKIEDIEIGFFKFIKSNTDLLIEFISSSGFVLPEKKEESKKFKHLDIEIYKYILYISENDDEMFEIFQEILLGSIISIVLLYNHDDRDIEESFKPLTIYLDSNFLFSLFGIHAKEYNKAAKELFEMLRREPNFKIKVFDFTLAEMSRVLNGYSVAILQHPKGIRPNSLYDILRKRGWKNPQITEFVTTLEDKVRALGIEIESTDINLSKYEPDCISTSIDKARLELAKYKPRSIYNSETAFIESQNHDLAAICLIKKKREKVPRKIEDAKHIFLTSDLKLSKFNLEILGHNLHGTIPEVIPDRILTTILWLKNPSLNPNLPVNVIIASYSNTLLVKKEIWEKFYQVLLQLNESGKISQNDIATLLYHDYIETVLVELSEDEVSKIDEDFVLNSIENAKKKMAEEIGKKKEQEMEEKYRKLMEQREQELLEEGKRKQREQMLQQIEKISEKKANFWSFIISSGIVIVLVVILVSTLGIREALIGLILGGGGVVAQILKGYPKLKPYIKVKIKKKHLKELGLEE